MRTLRDLLEATNRDEHLAVDRLLLRSYLRIRDPERWFGDPSGRFDHGTPHDGSAGGALDRDGNTVRPTDPTAVRWCSLGAIKAELGQDVGGQLDLCTSEQAVMRLNAAAGAHIVASNDYAPHDELMRWWLFAMGTGLRNYAVTCEEFVAFAADAASVDELRDLYERIMDDRRPAIQRKLLLSMFAGDAECFRDVTGPAHEAYADQHGYDRALITPTELPTIPGSKLVPDRYKVVQHAIVKVPVLINALDEYDAVLWLDADAAPVPGAADVIAQLGPDDWQALPLVTRSNMPITCVWAIRSCHESQAFLAELWARCQNVSGNFMLDPLVGAMVERKPHGTTFLHQRDWAGADGPMLHYDYQVGSYERRVELLRERLSLLQAKR
jgi:hypothetical protein